MKAYDFFRMSKDGEYIYMNRDFADNIADIFENFRALGTFIYLMKLIDVKTLNSKIKINTTNIAAKEKRSPKYVRMDLDILVSKGIIKKKYGEVEILNLEKYMVD